MVPRLLETPTARTRSASIDPPAERPGPVVAAPGGVVVVLPVYNEGTVVGEVVDEVARFAGTPEASGYRFVFVDDGSTDNTAEAVRERILAHPGAPMDLYQMKANSGKGEAIHAAFRLVEADLLLFTDGDLAYSLDHLPALAAALRTADVAIGSRGLIETNHERTPPLRRVMGWTFNRLARIILGLPYRDTQAGLKGFRAEAAEAIFRRRRLSGFSFDVELLFIARRLGLRIAEIPAHPSHDHAAKPSNVRLLRDPARMFVALLAVRGNALLGRYA